MTAFMPLARRPVQDLASSKIREVANAGFGRSDILRFWFGESDQVTPAYIRDAGVEAIRAGRTFYAHNSGLQELREALSAYLSRLHQRRFSMNQVSCTSSGVSALMVVMQALLDPGDRVVAITPVWPNLTEMPRVLGAHIVRCPVFAGPGGWRWDIEQFLSMVTPDTRLVLLNSPSNPTGWTIPADDRRIVLEHCRRLGVWLVCDDVYERLYFDRALGSAPSIVAIADPEDRVISVNSFSKAWLMTGWRLGWILAPQAMEADLGKLIEYNTSCAPDFVQAAGVAAIEQGEPHVARLRDELAQRRDSLVSALGALAGVSAAPPEGGMYVFFRIEGEDDSVALCKRMIAEAGLGLAPGAAFGPEGEGWIRWCFSVEPELLDRGLDRFAAWIAARRA